MGRALWRSGVQDIGVASGDGAEVARIGATEEASGHCGVGEAEGAGGKKISTGVGIGALRGMDEDEQRATGQRGLFSSDRAGIGELARGGDQRWSGENLGAPVMGPIIGKALRLMARLYSRTTRVHQRTASRA